MMDRWIFWGRRLSIGRISREEMRNRASCRRRKLNKGGEGIGVAHPQHLDFDANCVEEASLSTSVQHQGGLLGFCRKRHGL